VPTAPKSSGRALHLYLFCPTQNARRKKDTAPIPHAGRREMSGERRKMGIIFLLKSDMVMK